MLYTGKGDGGTTKLFNTPKGERVSKSSAIFEALGTVDEINSHLGFCRAGVSALGYRVGEEKFETILFGLQQDLFIIQAELAGSEMTIVPEKVKYLEDVTNAAETLMPPITTFFVPGATEPGARFDVARTVARRAERAAIRAKEDGAAIGENTMAYLNRLSSVLYALARLSNHFSGITETPPTYQ